MACPFYCRVPRGLARIAILIAVAVACSRPADVERARVAQTEPQTGGTLVVGTGTDIGGVNQVLHATDSFTQSVLDLLYLRLFEEQPDYSEHPPTFLPELVQSHEWSEDRRVLTLSLRTDVAWSDGVLLSAEDVVWTWRVQTDPQISWAYAQSKENIAAMEAVDRHTVRVTFHQPNPSQLSDLNEGVILPRHAWSELPLSEWRQSADWFRDHLVVNGPFRLDSWRRQAEIVLHRNESYFKPQRPHLDRVVFRIIPQKSNRVGQLLAGELHFLDGLPPADATRLETSGRARLASYWPGQYDFICWNTGRLLFAHTEIRQALTMAIDRQALVDSLWSGLARISTSPIISTVWAHNAELDPWPYDPQRARGLLAGQGWRDTDGDGIVDRDDQPFSFTLTVNTNASVRVDAAIMIQEQLRRIGIDARVQRLEFQTLVAQNLAHEFDATLGGWNIDTSLDLTYAFHSDSIDKGYNFGRFVHPEVDRLIAQAKTLTDLEEKAVVLRRIQLYLHELQPYTFLWEPVGLVGMSTRLQAAQPNALDHLFHLEDWWLKPAE